MATQLTQLAKSIAKSLSESDPKTETSAAEQASWGYARKGYKLSLLGVVVSIMFAAIGFWLASTANNLAKVSTDLARKADTTRETIDSIRSMLKNQQKEIALQQVQIETLGKLLSIAAGDSRELIVLTGNAGGQLKLLARQYALSLLYKAREYKADSSQFATAFDDIKKLETQNKYNYGYSDGFTAFSNLSITARKIYFENLKKDIDSQFKNYYLLADDSLYNIWQQLSNHISEVLITTSYPMDDLNLKPADRPWTFKQDTEFLSRYSKFLHMTEMKLNMR